MARSHWLDPLARRLLVATGHLPPDPPASLTTKENRRWPGLPSNGSAQNGSAQKEKESEAELVERELLALKLQRDPGLALRDAADVKRLAALGWRLDVNRATATDWRRLPGCTAARVDLLLRLQAGGVQLSGPEDLRQVLELEEAELRAWEPVLVFRWYGHAPAADRPAPVPVNRASPRALEALPGLTPQRRERLLRERVRTPFRDLADLQVRLCLPAEVVEGWIGRVSFAPGPAGPVLPPAAGPRP